MSLEGAKFKRPSYLWGFHCKVEPMRVLCVVVDYRKARMVRSCVQTILAQKADAELQIRVVDNSCDSENAAFLKPLEKLTDVDVTINEQNNGYTCGCNQAVSGTKSDYVLLISPDVRFDDSGVLDHLIQTMEADQSIAICGPRQENRNGMPPDNVRQFCSPVKPILNRILPNWPVFASATGREFFRKFDYSTTASVDWLQSSCILIRRDFWDSCGGLSEEFFLFVSEVDLARKAWEGGLRVLYVGDAQVTADGVRVSRGGFADVFTNWVVRRLIMDNWVYYRHHAFRANPRLAMARLQQGDGDQTRNEQRGRAKVVGKAA